jgi:hypothetical protein
MHRQTFAFFRLTDPLPAIARTGKMISMTMRGGKSAKAPAPAPKPPAPKPVAVIGPPSPEDQLMATESDAEAAAA